MKKHIARGASPLLLILLLAAIGYLGCKKDDPTEEEKLPAATQEGKKTFGCLVDGVAWIPKSSGLFDPRVDFDYDEITGGITIWAQKYFENTTTQEYVSLYLSDAKSPMEYELLPMLNSWIDDKRNCNSSYPEFGALPGGKIRISKLDTSLGIISGTFEFDAYNEQCQDTVRITKGRFDYKYK